MACEPGPSVAVLNVASSTPSTTASATDGSDCPSTVKVTVPVGVPAPLGPVTVAVKVTGWPKVAGFDDEVRVVAVVAWIVFVRGGVALLGAKVPSPP